MDRTSFDSILNYNYVAITQGNGYDNSFDNCLAYSNTKLPFNKLKELQLHLDTVSHRVFGYLSYDLKNELEQLTSENTDTIDFDPLFFFEGQNTIEFNIKSLKPKKNSAKITFKSNWSKEEYINTVKEIQHQIKEGDIYEMNFCIEFHAENVNISPFDLYLKLNQLSPTPFSSFIKNENQYIICASPERFLKKVDTKITSQPIKGTSKRHNTKSKDLESKEYLKNSEKEMAENLMIVDLVRNDLAKTAIPGSVKVDELFGIYTFPQVHQMISTISSEVSINSNALEIIQGAYPMGSMTGAPKVMAMKLIEAYEKNKRGPFSGTIGYFDPNGDFDLNVIIRSIFYNETTKVLSFQVGSAITIDSDPESEYNECLLKAKAIFSCFE